MKRASIAEMTLDKQIRAFEAQHEELRRAVTQTRVEMETIETVINQLREEKLRLEGARKAMSERNSAKREQDLKGH